MTTAEKLSAIDLQKEAGELVGNNVYANIGQFMDFCIKKSWEGRDDDNPVDADDINFEVNPSGWDAAKIKEYLDDTFNMTWEEVTDERWEKGTADDAIDAVRDWITDNAEEDVDEVPPTAYYDEDGKLLSFAEWNDEHLHDYLENIANEGWESITGVAFDATVADDEDEYEDEIEKARDYIRDNAERREIFEWWIISDWLGRKLKSRGYIVLDLGNLTVWGRETTGQAIKIDGVIEEITLEILEERAKWTSDA